MPKRATLRRPRRLFLKMPAASPEPRSSMRREITMRSTRRRLPALSCHAPAQDRLDDLGGQGIASAGERLFQTGDFLLQFGFRLGDLPFGLTACRFNGRGALVLQLPAKLA